MANRKEANQEEHQHLLAMKFYSALSSEPTGKWNAAVVGVEEESLK